MQGKVRKAKEVIQQDVWGVIQDFLNITLYRFNGKVAGKIHITVGIVFLIVLASIITTNRSTRELISVRVAHGGDIEKVKEILLECARLQNGIVKKPEPLVLFEDFGESALIFSIHFFVSDSFVDPKIKSELRFKFAHKYKLEGISMPFPQRDLHLFYPDKSLNAEISS